jgi:hypothetical protein
MFPDICHPRRQERGLRAAPFGLMAIATGRVRRRVNLSYCEKAELKRWTPPKLEKLSSREAKNGVTVAGDGSLVS